MKYSIILATTQIKKIAVQLNIGFFFKIFICLPSFPKPGTDRAHPVRSGSPGRRDRNAPRRLPPFRTNAPPSCRLLSSLRVLPPCFRFASDAAIRYTAKNRKNSSTFHCIYRSRTWHEKARPKRRPKAEAGLKAGARAATLILGLLNICDKTTR